VDGSLLPTFGILKGLRKFVKQGVYAHWRSTVSAMFNGFLGLHRNGTGRVEGFFTLSLASASWMPLTIQLETRALSV
jgi:hypothetical protein